MTVSLAGPTLCLTLGAASFLGVATLVRATVPWPDPILLRPKMTAFERVKDDVEVVIIGSSRSFRGIDPVALDDRLAERGHPLRTWNLAMGGMRRHEAAGLLRRVLALEPARLRLVVVEWGPWEATFDAPRNVWTDRSVFWHDGVGTRLAVAGALEEETPWSERLTAAGTHVALFLHRLSSYGRALDVFAARTGADGPTNRLQARVVRDMIRRRGYRAHGVVSPAPHAPGFLAELDEWAAEVARIDRENDISIATAPAAARALDVQLEAIRAAGAEAIFITGPGAEATPEAHSLARAGRLELFFPLNSPSRHPVLYENERHFERLHLNDAGAEAASRLLADLLADHLDQDRTR